MISNKLALWYLNHISTMEKERERESERHCSSKARQLTRFFVLEHTLYSVRAHSMDGIVCAKEKPRISWMDGWMDGWVGTGVRGMGSEEEIRTKNEGVLKWLHMSLPPFLQLHRYAEKKRNRQKQISGEYPSHCFMNHLQVEIGAAEGGSHATASAHLKSLKLLRWNVWGGTRKVSEMSLGSDFRGQEITMFSKCVQKYLSDYCWDMNPFFCLNVFSLLRFRP